MDGEAFVAYANAGLIGGEIVDAAIDVLIDHAARLEEHILHIIGGLRRRLHEDEAVLAGEALPLLERDLAARVQIVLVSDQHDDHIRISVLADLFQPPRQMGERIAPRNIVDK